MTCISPEIVQTRLTELLESGTKDSFNHICKILMIPKRETEPAEERQERLSFAIEVFKRVPAGCLWRRTAKEVKDIARTVNVKSRGKAKGIAALEEWHKKVIGNFARAKEKSSHQRRGIALMKAGKPIPFEILEALYSPNFNAVFMTEIYMSADVAYDHAKGRDAVLHFGERSEDELAELEVLGQIIENPLETLFEQGLEKTEAFEVYRERALQIVNYEMATSLLSSEFAALLKLIKGIPDIISAPEFLEPGKWSSKQVAYLERMKLNLYFSMQEWGNRGSYQNSLL